MVNETTPKPCSHGSCKCQADAEASGSEIEKFCSEFCEKSDEGSPDFSRCGCGHSQCDATKQIGNEETFQD